MTNCFLFSECNHKDCENEFCLRKYKLDFLYNASCLPPHLWKKLTLSIDADKTDLDKFSRLAEISKNIEQHVQNGKNIFLHSAQCGNGKSSWAIRLLQCYLNKIWPKSELTCRALYIDVPTFLISLKDNISSKNNYVAYVKDNVLDADLVIWDEIGAKLGSEFEINNLLSLINSRLSAGKANIYTSNLNKSQMMQALGERLASRIVNYSEEIEFFGKDKRVISKEGLN